MIKKSFAVFISDPLRLLWSEIFSNFTFIYKFIIDYILMRNISNVSKEDILQEAFKFFKLLIFFILINISINEIFLNKDSDMVHDFKSEIAYLSFFYISFLIYYYFSAFYIKITSNTIHHVLVIRTWLMLIFTLTLFYQFSGALNPNNLNEKTFLDLLINDTLVVYSIFLVIEIYHIFKLIKTNQIKWYDSFFYLIVFASYLIFISIKSIMIQQLLS
jgi:hypothetical protein